MKLGEIAKKSPFPFYGTILSVVLLAYGGYRYTEVPATQELMDQKSREALRLQANKVNATSINEQLAELKELNKRVEGRVARATDLAGNTQYFYKVQAEAGVKEVGLSPDVVKGASAKKTGAFSTVGFTCTVEGRLEQILAFATKLEGGAWLGRVTTFSVRQLSANEGRADPALSATIKVELLAIQ